MDTSEILNLIKSEPNKFSVGRAVPEYDINKVVTKRVPDIQNEFVELLLGSISERNLSLDQLFGNAPSLISLLESLFKDSKIPKLDIKYHDAVIFGRYRTKECEIDYYKTSELKKNVFRLHERFHALHHLMPDPVDGKIWEDFPIEAPFYQELLAQLFTIKFAKDISPVIVREFHNINKSQSILYKTWRLFEHLDKEQVLDLYWMIRNRKKLGINLGWLDELSRIFNPESFEEVENHKVKWYEPESDVNYWLVGSYKETEFLKKGIWELGWSDDEKPLLAKRRDSIKSGDRIAMKALRGWGAGTITIKMIGIVDSIDSNKTVHVTWLVTDMNREVYSRGCFGSIHGAYKLNDAWTRNVFCI